MSFVAAIPLLPIAAAFVLAGVIIAVVYALRRAPTEVPGFAQMPPDGTVVPLPQPHAGAPTEREDRTGS